MRVKIVNSQGSLIDPEVHLNDIVGVAVDCPMNGQMLRYNASNGLWECVTLNAPSGQYHDRGDPSSWDYSKADLSTDGAWHTLDLFSIVPVGTTLVHLFVAAVIAYPNSYIQFRKNGVVNDINKKVIVILFGNKEYYEEVWIACDADRKIEYWMSNRTWVQLDVLIRGWMK